MKTFNISLLNPHDSDKLFSMDFIKTAVLKVCKDCELHRIPSELKYNLKIEKEGKKLNEVLKEIEYQIDDIATISDPL
jgi:hypothetical protein